MKRQLLLRDSIVHVIVTVCTRAVTATHHLPGPHSAVETEKVLHRTSISSAARRRSNLLQFRTRQVRQLCVVHSDKKIQPRVYRFQRYRSIVHKFANLENGTGQNYIYNGRLILGRIYDLSNGAIMTPNPNFKNMSLFDVDYLGNGDWGQQNTNGNLNKMNTPM